MPPLFRRIASIEGRDARLALWAEALVRLDPAEAARELDLAVRGVWAGDSWALAAYLALVDLPSISDRTGPGRLAAVLEAARDDDLAACLLLLEDPGRRKATESLGPPPDPVVESLTLGHRKTAARGPRNPLLDRLLKDPDARVVAELLRNPRLREVEVLAIASRRPCPDGVFWHLARSEVWLRRPPVRRAVVQNPYAPPRLAVPLLVTLSRLDVAEIAEQEGLHPGVRAGAREVLGW